MLLKEENRLTSGSVVGKMRKPPLGRSGGVNGYTSVQLEGCAMKALTAALLSLGLVGCAAAPKLGPDQFVFTFESQPSGALVYRPDGVALGTTPYRSVFNVDSRIKDRESIDSTFVVVWPSGAKLQTSKVWKPKQTKTWRFVFDRPISAPGMDIDLRHAAAQQATRAQQAKAESDDNRAAAAALLGGFLAGQQRGSADSTVIFPPTHCTSRQLGNTTKTDCF